MTQITIPLPYALLAAFVVAVILIAQLPLTNYTKQKAPLEELQDKLGLQGVHAGVFLLLALFWGTLFGILFAGLVKLILDFGWGPAPTADQLWDWRFALAKLTALTGVLGVVVALPFTLIRLTLSMKQRAHDDDTLANEKINTAVKDLYSQRQVTKWADDGTANNGWQDDIPRRNGAIDALEGLCHTYPDMRPRIDRLLSTYLRELSREYPAETPPKDANPNELRDWARGLKPKRSDMETAAQTLARLPRSDDERTSGKLPDLQGMNLQGFNLRQLNLLGSNLAGAQLQGTDLPRAQLQGANLIRAESQGANLAGARLQGSNLRGARFLRANLGGAQLQGAGLVEAQVQGADLPRAQLQGANLFRAELQGANLFRAELQGASLFGAQLQGANLRGARLQRADLSGAQFSADTSLTAATLRGAAVREVDFTDIPQIADHVETLFGDATVKLPDGVNRPARFNIIYESYEDFFDAWRAFQREIGQDPYNPQ